MTKDNKVNILPKLKKKESFHVVALVTGMLSPLPNDRILDWSKLKATADDKIKVLNMVICVFNVVENIVGKGENAVLPQCI